MSPWRTLHRTEPARWGLLLAVLLVVIGLGGSAAYAGPAESQTVFAPVSPPAQAINGLFILTLAICSVILILVGGAIVWFSIKYRHREGDSDEEPPQLYGSHRIEIAWTLGPLLIVFVLFLVVFRVVADIQGATAPKHALHVTVVAHQWWWEFDYPGLGIKTANELHVPVSPDGKRDPVFLKLLSADVIHDFWVPRLSGKQDVVPGHPNKLWFAPEKPGIYYGQCAEFCGAQHANMAFRVVAQTPAKFKQWVKNQQKPALPASALKTAEQRQGRKLFMSEACSNCHTVKGTDANGTFGPDLTHLMSRAMIGAEVAKNDHANLMSWVQNPQVLKPGCHMPSLHLDHAQTKAVVAYLETLH